jgi:hypothetical protein
MYDIVLIFLIVAVTIILFIALTKATEAAAAIGNSEDPYLSSAHGYLTWTVTILWIIVIGMFVGFAFLLFFGPEFLPIFGKEILYGMLTILVLAMVAVGVISSIAANDIRLSPAKGTVPTAYDDAYYAALYTLIPIGLVVLGYVVIWYKSRKVKASGVPPNGPVDATTV